MKFWPMYGERWTAKTSHLSPMREGLYLRMVIWTMTHERPLPLAPKDCNAIARTKNSQQAGAVADLLAEFFERRADGYHQKTADEVLEWWRTSGEAASVTRRHGTQARMVALRRRLDAMHQALRSAGVKTHSRMGVGDLKRLAAEHCVTLPDGGDCVTRDAMRDGVRDAYIHNPVTQSPPSGAPVGVTQRDAPAPAPAPESIEDDKPGPYTRALRALHGAGMVDAYPGHPVFVELVAAGVPPRTFEATAHEAQRRGKGFGWCMATIKGRLSDGPPSPANGAPSAPGEFAEGLLTPEGRERLEAAMADPARDPWELPPISGPPLPSKHEGT